MEEKDSSRMLLCHVWSEHNECDNISKTPTKDKPNEQVEALHIEDKLESLATKVSSVIYKKVEVLNACPKKSKKAIAEGRQGTFTLFLQAGPCWSRTWNK